MEIHQLLETQAHGTTFFPIRVYDEPLGKNEYNTTQHFHPEFEMTYVVEGQGVLISRDSLQAIVPGGVVLVKPNQLHTVNRASKEEFSRVTFVFSLDLISSRKMDYSTIKYIAPLYQENTWVAPWIGPELPGSGEILELMQELYELYKNKQPYFELKIKILLLRIFELLYQYGHIRLHSDLEIKSRSDTEKLEEIYRYIHENFRGNITLEKIANHHYYDKYHLLKFFKRMTGTTCFEYISNCRLNYALSLLMDTDMTVTQIALESGFNSSSFFIKTFRDKYGITPSKCRASYFRNVPME